MVKRQAIGASPDAARSYEATFPLQSQRQLQQTVPCRWSGLYVRHLTDPHALAGYICTPPICVGKASHGLSQIEASFGF